MTYFKGQFKYSFLWAFQMHETFLNSKILRVGINIRFFANLFHPASPLEYKLHETRKWVLYTFTYTAVLSSLFYM